MKKLKKGWINLVLINLFLSISVSYVLFAYVFKFISEEDLELQEALLMPKEVLTVLFNHPELKVILPFLPVLLFSGFLYLLRKSIFDLKYDDASKFGVKGEAKFGNPEKLMDGKILVAKQKYGDLNKSLELEDGIILGIVPETKNVLTLGDKTSLATKNVFVAGSSGAGKGQGYVLNNIINNKDESMIVIDPKGENFSLTAQLKRDQGYKVYNVDFRNFEFERYNPLDYVKNDEDAQRISLIMTVNSGLDESYFTERAQKLLAGLISYVKSEFPTKEANMDQINNVYQQYVSDFEVCDKWLSRMPDSHPAKSLLVSVLGDLESVNTRSSVTSSFQAIVSIFRFNRIKRMTAVSDFKFDDFVEEKTIVYVKIPAPSNPYKALTSVFISQMIERFFELGDLDPLGRLKTPIHFMLDEFPNIGKIDSYQETLALCRGYRMYMHTIIQDISQLEDKKLYGKEQTKAILANHSVKIILKIGEQESAEYWSKWFGKTTISYESKSASYSSKGGKTSNVNTQYEQKDLVTSTELMNIDDERAYILLSGHDPIIVQKAWQYLIYPNLLSDNHREPNYLNIRRSLGYLDKPESDLRKHSNDDIIDLFATYNDKNQTESVMNLEEEEQKSESPTVNVPEANEQVATDESVTSESQPKRAFNLENISKDYNLLKKDIEGINNLESMIGEMFGGSEEAIEETSKVNETKGVSVVANDEEIENIETVEATEEIPEVDEPKDVSVVANDEEAEEGEAVEPKDVVEEEPTLENLLKF